MILDFISEHVADVSSELTAPSIVLGFRPEYHQYIRGPTSLWMSFSHHIGITKELK